MSLNINTSAFSNGLLTPVGAEPRSRPSSSENSMRFPPGSDEVFAADSKAPSFEGAQDATKTQDIRLQEPHSQNTQLGLDKEKAALKEIAEELNRRFKSLPKTHLQFLIDEKAGRIVVKVIDSEEQKLIRQIPSEDFLKLAVAIKEQLDSELQKAESSVLVTNKFFTEPRIGESFLLSTQI